MTPFWLSAEDVRATWLAAGRADADFPTQLVVTDLKSLTRSALSGSGCVERAAPARTPLGASAYRDSLSLRQTDSSVARSRRLNGHSLMLIASARATAKAQELQEQQQQREQDRQLAGFGDEPPPLEGDEPPPLLSAPA